MWYSRTIMAVRNIEEAGSSEPILIGIIGAGGNNLEFSLEPPVPVKPGQEVPKTVGRLAKLAVLNNASGIFTEENGFGQRELMLTAQQAEIYFNGHLGPALPADLPPPQVAARVAAVFLEIGIIAMPHVEQQAAILAYTRFAPQPEGQ
jgi:hypothetical protein